MGMVDSWGCHITSVLVRLSRFFSCRQRQGNSQMWVVEWYWYQMLCVNIEPLNSWVKSYTWPPGRKFGAQVAGLSKDWVSLKPLDCHYFLHASGLHGVNPIFRYSQTLPNTALQDYSTPENPSLFQALHLSKSCSPRCFICIGTRNSREGTRHCCRVMNGSVVSVSMIIH
jgi:hypothetical protein